MRINFYIGLVLLCFTSCSDGDVIEVGLDFDQTLTLCNQVSNTYLLYDIKSNPFESLSLTFPVNSTNNSIFNPAETPSTRTLTIDGTAVRFNYRTYSGNPEDLLCALVPDPNVTIINDYEAPSGLVTTVTTFKDDDEDGIPTSVEDLNLDGDDNPETNATDSDGDGIPDYKDADDDNDNVLTRFENVNYSVEFGLTLAQDTDGNNVPDYLDDDDDGDGVLTRYEDEDANLDPRNDRDENSETPDIFRYLDPTANDSFQDDIDVLDIKFVPNTFKRSFVVKFTLTQINLQILSTDLIEFGRYEYSAIFQ